MLRKIACLLLIAAAAAALCACSLLGGIGQTGETKDGKTPGGTLAAGKWPASVYSRYGIDEIPTGGRIVCTELTNDGPYQYRVYYENVTREEMVAWINGLVGKGFRIADTDKERLSESTYSYDISVYSPEEKQPSRMRVSFDFGTGMSFEYYSDDTAGVILTEEVDDYGDSHFYVVYNFTVSLNPIKNEEEYEGDFPSLGLKAEDLKGIDAVRRIGMGEAANMSAINFTFYADHLTTKEDAEACRVLLIDKLAEKGAAFYDGLDSEKVMTASELKESGKGSYYVENNGKRFLVMVNPDASAGHYGDFYGVILTTVNR